MLNKFQVLDQLLEGETITEKWQAIKESFTSTCKEVLDPEEQPHKEWISGETLQKIKERKVKEGRNQQLSCTSREKPRPTLMLATYPRRVQRLTQGNT